MTQLLLGTPGRVMTARLSVGPTAPTPLLLGSEASDHFLVTDPSSLVFAQVSVPQSLAIRTEGVRYSGGVGVVGARAACGTLVGSCVHYAWSFAPEFPR